MQESILVSGRGTPGRYAQQQQQQQQRQQQQQHLQVAGNMRAGYKHHGGCNGAYQAVSMIKHNPRCNTLLFIKQYVRQYCCKYRWWVGHVHMQQSMINMLVVAIGQTKVPGRY